MTRLEEVKAGVAVRGITPERLARVVGVYWHGEQAIKVVYAEGDRVLLRLVPKAIRISLAHLFDPYLAIHTSRVEPLSHQITAFYGKMLKRQPLRILLTGCPTALFSELGRLCS